MSVSCPTCCYDDLCATEQSATPDVTTFSQRLRGLLHQFLAQWQRRRWEQRALEQMDSMNPYALRDIGLEEHARSARQLTANRDPLAELRRPF